MKAICLIAVAIVGGLAACNGDVVDLGAASILFKYDAPFCGTGYIERRVDGLVIARDSLKSGATSAPFTTQDGTHVLGARALRGSPDSLTTLYAWPDTTVTLGNGSSVTRVLSLYCS